jgi:tetratricopeptide (TPR) repeat protein
VYGLQRENIRYLESALAAANRWSNPEAEMIVRIRLGTTYASLDDIKEAIEHYYQALYIARDLGDRHSERGVLNSIGIACAKFGHTELAIAFLNQCLAVTLEANDLPGASAASWNVGLVLEFQGNLTLAVELMQFCVDYERKFRHSDAEEHAARLESLRQRLAASQGTPPADDTDEG